MARHEKDDVLEEAVTESKQAESQRSPARRVFGWVTETAFILVSAIVIATLLRTFVGQMFVIPTGSMEHTIEVNDRALASKIGGFQRGDVVVFEDPGDWLPTTQRSTNPIQAGLEFIGVLPNSGTEHLIKRAIGMPGDKVKCCDAGGRIEVNGHALDESSYLYTEDGAQVAPATVPFEVVVPKDHIFVMGDHRNSSADSRCRLAETSRNPGKSAFVPVSKVVGPAVAIVAPLERLSTFTVPETFKSVPPPESPAPDQPTLIRVEPGC